MKEIIRYMGGGFLAVAVGAGVLFIMFSTLPKLGNVGEVFNQQPDGEATYDLIYGTARGKGDIQVEWILEQCIITGRLVDLKSFFCVTDGNEAEVVPEIMQIEHEVTGSQMIHYNGVCRFAHSGIYKVLMKCNNVTFEVRVPVNPGGGNR